MDDVTIARAMHVLAVLHWIGGVAFVTTVVLPAVSALSDPSRRLELFEAIEQRFSAQVKISVPVAGLTGAYMADRLDSWGRFLAPDSWWLATMAVVWIAFMVILFVIEPLVLRNWFRQAATARPASTFRAFQRAHWGLLAISMVTAAAGVLGAHGLLG